MDANETEAMLALSEDTSALRRLTLDGATDTELAAIYAVPLAEFVATYGVLLTKARAELNGRVRRYLLAAADKGDGFALAYLAGAYLDGVTDGTRADAERRADRPRLLERIRSALMGRRPV